jgi:hypothetical protein
MIRLITQRLIDDLAIVQPRRAPPNPKPAQHARGISASARPAGCDSLMASAAEAG